MHKLNALTLTLIHTHTHTLTHTHTPLSLETLTVVLGKGGSHAWYSEPCAAILVSTPSNDGRGKITTASLSSLQPGNIGDVAGSCTSTFGGTSESAASLSGVIALILEANPSLTWRDVQHILVR